MAHKKPINRSVKGVSDEAWAKFKIACIKEGVTMGNKITQLILDYVTEPRGTKNGK